MDFRLKVMTPLFLTLAAILSVCSGQGSRFFNPRRVAGFTQTIDPPYEVLMPGRGGQRFNSGPQFQGNARIIPIIRRLTGANGRIQMGNIGDLGITPSFSHNSGSTNRFRIQTQRPNNVRRVVTRVPFRQNTRRVNLPADDVPPREGYIGARGGVDGFPVFGGYCAGEMCNDGGQAAGVGNGYGPGSLSAFLERRRTGQNEDIRMYERFAGGPNGNNARQNRI